MYSCVYIINTLESLETLALHVESNKSVSNSKIAVYNGICLYVVQCNIGFHIYVETPCKLCIFSLINS